MQPEELLDTCNMRFYMLLHKASYSCTDDIMTTGCCQVRDGTTPSAEADSDRSQPGWSPGTAIRGGARSHKRKPSKHRCGWIQTSPAYGRSGDPTAMREERRQQAPLMRSRRSPSVPSIPTALTSAWLQSYTSHPRSPMLQSLLALMPIRHCIFGLSSCEPCGLRSTDVGSLKPLPVA